MLRRVIMAGVRKVEHVSSAKSGRLGQVQGVQSNSSPIYKAVSDTALGNGMKNLSLQDRTSGQRRGIYRSYSSKPTVRCLKDAANMIKDQYAKNIVIVAGAGISTPSGIPDFRTPGTGLYDNLQQYRIPYPEAIFDIDYFYHNPKPFFTLARELYPSGKYRPNYIHYFLRLLHDRGQLLRMYTQNIDGLERLAGIPADKLVEAHGTFATAACTICGHKHEGSDVKDEIFADKIPKCKKRSCWGVVKPDIVFFGEDLPKRFYFYLKDMLQADLVLVMGTSLEVQPFAGIVDIVRGNVPRILFNREPVGPFKYQRRSQDIVCEGDLIGGIQKFVNMMECKTDMIDLITQSEGTFKICEVNTSKPSKPSTTKPKQSSDGSIPMWRQKAHLNLYEASVSDWSSSESSESTDTVSSDTTDDSDDGGGRKPLNGTHGKTVNSSQLKNNGLKNERNGNLNKPSSGSKFKNGNILTNNTSRSTKNRLNSDENGKRRIHSASRVSSLTQRRTVNDESRNERRKNATRLKGLENKNKVSKSNVGTKGNVEDSSQNDSWKLKEKRLVLLKKSQSDTSVQLEGNENNIDKSKPAENCYNAKGVPGCTEPVLNRSENILPVTGEENKTPIKETLGKKMQKEHLLARNGSEKTNMREMFLKDRRVKISYKESCKTQVMNPKNAIPVSDNSCTSLEHTDIRSNLKKIVEKPKNEVTASLNGSFVSEQNYKDNLIKLHKLRSEDSLTNGLVRRNIERLNSRATDKDTSNIKMVKPDTCQNSTSKDGAGVNYAEMFCWDSSFPKLPLDDEPNKLVSKDKVDRLLPPRNKPSKQLQPVNAKPYGFGNLRHPPALSGMIPDNMIYRNGQINPASKLYQRSESADLPRIAYRHRLQPSYDARIMNYGISFDSSSPSVSSGDSSDDCC